MVKQITSLLWQVLVKSLAQIGKNSLRSLLGANQSVDFLKLSFGLLQSNK